MIDYHRNSGIYNMVAEGEVADILAHYNSDYIMSIIKENIANRLSCADISLESTNIVTAFEINFKSLLTQYPNDTENIMQARQETYNEIITNICNAFKLQFNAGDESDSGYGVDRYNAAFYLYDIFISGLMRNTVNFFAKYIVQNKEALYNNLELYKYKKDRDSTTMYAKSAYNDITIASIISKIKNVIYYISGFDLNLYTILSYNYNEQTRDFIYSIATPTENIFNTLFCKYCENPTVLTEIRLAIQQIVGVNMSSATMQQLINTDYQNQKPTSDDNQQGIESDTPTDNL